MFLTTEQLQEMTGYQTYSRMVVWLADNGYSFDVRSDGRPNVLLEQVRERQVARGKSGKSKPGPDFSWLPEGT